MSIVTSRTLSILGALVAFLSAALFSTESLAQACSTGGPVTLTSQAQVNSFQTDYGGGATCDTLTDNLTITGADITDLSPLGITTVTINTRLIISGNPSLANLDGIGLVTAFWLELTNNDALASIGGLSTVTAINGPLFIQDNAILTNVDGLGNITSLSGGTLWLQDNPMLSDLSALAGLTVTGGSLVIWNNDALTDLSALSNLTSVNGMVIQDNALLSDISSLSGITNSAGSVYIRTNPSLTSVAGLSGLTFVGGLIIDSNPLLTNLDPLSNLTGIGDIAGLGIIGNTGLTSIDGLSNVEGVGWDVEVSGNTSLSDCSILERLLDQVDDFAPGPGPGGAGIPDTGADTVTISGNGPGCSSLEDIVGAAPPPSAPPGGGSATPIPTMSHYALLALALLVLAAGATRLRRAS